jgi:hypothetical protein
LFAEGGMTGDTRLAESLSRPHPVDTCSITSLQNIVLSLKRVQSDSQQ